MPITDARTTAVQRTAQDTLTRASKEPYYNGACKVMYTGLASLQNVSVASPSNSPELAETLNDVVEISRRGDSYAHSFERYTEAAPVLYQALADAAYVAQGQDKLSTAGAILEHAEKLAHSQKFHSQAAVGMYQALADLQTVARHADPATSERETALLASLDKVAGQTIENAGKMAYWNGASQILYSGIDSLQAILA